MTSAANQNSKRHRYFISMLTLTASTFLLTPVLAEEPAPRHRTVRFEIRFMMDMVEHHTMAVEMAELCTERAVHDELESLCHEMIAAQSAEIDEMQSWLHDWYGIHYQPHMSGQDRRDLRELARLHGQRFEIRFMRMMIEHHSIAIDRAEECVDRAFHEELLNLCHNIIVTQSDEIDLMSGWLCQWYHICH